MEEYHRIAPGIVRRVESRSDAAAICRDVALRYLEPAVALVRSGRNAEAHALYRALVAELLGRFPPEADRLAALIPQFDLRFDEQERRVVFPVREGGRELGYTARSIDARQRKRWIDYPYENCHKTTIYDADRVRAGGNTLFIVEGPFDALMVTAAIQPGNNSVTTAFFGSMPTDQQLAQVATVAPFYRMVYMMLDENVWGRCFHLARVVAKLAGVPNVGAINIGFEYRDPGAMRFEELQRLVTFASASWALEIHWMWERRRSLSGV